MFIVLGCAGFAEILEYPGHFLARLNVRFWLDPSQLAEFTELYIEARPTSDVRPASCELVTLLLGRADVGIKDLKGRTA